MWRRQQYKRRKFKGVKVDNRRVTFCRVLTYFGPLCMLINLRDCNHCTVFRSFYIFMRQFSGSTLQFGCSHQISNSFTSKYRTHRRVVYWRSTTVDTTFSWRRMRQCIDICPSPKRWPSRWPCMVPASSFFAVPNRLEDAYQFYLRELHCEAKNCAILFSQ